MECLFDRKYFARAEWDSQLEDQIYSVYGNLIFIVLYPWKTCRWFLTQETNYGDGENYPWKEGVYLSQQTTSQEAA
jgi:hypothetical protein